MSVGAGPSGHPAPPGFPEREVDPIRRTLKGALARVQAAAGKWSEGHAARGGSGGGPGASTAPARDRGPDRVSEMEGGNRFLIARRRARRRDLAKEAANVGLATLLIGLGSGVLLDGLGAGADVAAVLALALAAGCGWILGREVAADIVENERVLEKGGRPR